VQTCPSRTMLKQRSCAPDAPSREEETTLREAHYVQRRNLFSR